MNIKLKELLIILLLLLVSIPAVKSLFIPGGYTSHDLTHHVIRQISMDKLLKEGQFPPRWSGELNKEYGYPVFLFNYPLPALFGESFYLLGFSFLYSVKAVLFSSMILSIIGMYLFLRTYLNSSLAAFLGAVFYLYAPYRFLNIYVGASVGSALAYGIVPFVFWGITKIYQTKKPIWVLLTGLFLALLILSHNVTTVMFGPLILAFMAVLIFQTKEKMGLVKKFILTGVLALGLSCWFWLPAVFEKEYIKFDELYKGFYNDHFPSLQQLIKSKWGYGLSNPKNPKDGDLSYQIGLIHILVMGLLTISVLVNKKIRKIGGFIIAVFLLSIFLILEVSKVFWDLVPFISLVQFPWRFSIISVFASSIGAALLIKYLPFRKILFIFLLVLVLYANRNHWRINEVFDPGDEYYKSLKTTTATYSEHLPKWGKAMSEEPLGKLEFIEGGGDIKYSKVYSNKIFAEVEASSSSQIRLNQFYFPGWEVKVNNEKVKFEYKIQGESYGMPIFNIKKGKSFIQTEFKNTMDRNLADTVSLVSVIVWVVAVCKLLISQKQGNKS